MNTAYLDMIQGKNPGVTPVWYMRQAGRSQAEYRKIKEKYTLFEITKEPELCARVTELPVKEYGVDAAILYKDIMSPMVAMNVNVELKAGVGPVFSTPIRSMADIDKLEAFDPTKVDYIAKTITLLTCSTYRSLVSAVRRLRLRPTSSKGVRRRTIIKLGACLSVHLMYGIR